MKIFSDLESEVQSYSRSFPVVFERSQKEFMWDVKGRRYLDFLAGAGSLNYGHNNPVFKEALVRYIQKDGIVHGLDMHTDAKAEFLEALNEKILKPRGLDYVVQFTGPTGTNAVEAAMKIARNITGQQNIVVFTNGFHGVSLGALAATGNSHHRDAAGVGLAGTHRMPFDGYLGKDFDTIAYLDKALTDSSSGVNSPSAVLVETIQGEGGVNVASVEWLRRLEAVCRKHEILLIVDDIQAGCGRTGKFFSFEESGISPDIVTLSKSLSGFGLPFSIVLMKPFLDRWKPGEHNGTFRGNNLAFITAKAAIDEYWSNNEFEMEVKRKGCLVEERLKNVTRRFEDQSFEIRGKGLLVGLDVKDGGLASEVSRRAFKRGLLIETSGSSGQVIKVLCPLTISDENLKTGMEILEYAIEDALIALSKRVDRKKMNAA